MFTEALCYLLDFVRGKTFIKCDKALPVYLLLIPLIYMRHFHATWKQGKDVEIKAKLLDSRRGSTPFTRSH